jgi:origin recognition complex subunit 3
MINMYDWFTAFGMILERGLTTSKNQDEDNDDDDGEDGDVEEDDTRARKRARGKQKPKATTTTTTTVKTKQQKQQPEQPPQRLDQKEVQARFISGVAELQFMGFIKPTNRKTDHVQRLTWGNI